MSCTRRGVLRAFTGAAGAAALGVSSRGETSKFSMPGLHPGRVVAATASKPFANGKYNAAAIQAMVRKGMCELTGAPAWQDAWRRFFEPGDVVGIKVNPSGYPICSSQEMMAAILEGLAAVGVKPADVVVYDRYQDQFTKAGVAKWLPEGVRTITASTNWREVQED